MAFHFRQNRRSPSPVPGPTLPPQLYLPAILQHSRLAQGQSSERWGCGVGSRGERPSMGLRPFSSLTSLVPWLLSALGAVTLVVLTLSLLPQCPFLLAPPEFLAGGHVSCPRKMVGLVSACEPVGSPWPLSGWSPLLCHGLPPPGLKRFLLPHQGLTPQSVPPCLSASVPPPTHLESLLLPYCLLLCPQTFKVFPRLQNSTLGLAAFYNPFSSFISKFLQGILYTTFYLHFFYSYAFLLTRHLNVCLCFFMKVI